MNLVDLFIEICSLDDSKNEVLHNYLNIDKNKSNKMLIKCKLNKNRVYLGDRQITNKKSKFKNLISLVDDIYENLIHKNKDLDTKNYIRSTKSNVEKFSILYKEYNSLLIDNFELIRKNNNEQKYLLSYLDGFEEIKSEKILVNDNNELKNCINQLKLLKKEKKISDTKIKDISKENTKLNKSLTKLQSDFNELLSLKNSLNQNVEKLNVEKSKLEEEILNYKLAIKNIKKLDTVVIDDRFSGEVSINYSFIHKSELDIIKKIHSDISFTSINTIKDMNSFIVEQKDKNIYKIFVESKNMKSLDIQKINDICKEQDVIFERIFFSFEKELNEKLSKLK